jgi:CheY-like chemotaxis protein
MVSTIIESCVNCPIQLIDQAKRHNRLGDAFSHKVQLPPRHEMGTLHSRAFVFAPSSACQMDDKDNNAIKIALIDDDASVRSAVSRLLRSNNYACRGYESAESALADPSLPDVHCLVVDVQLSGMSGFAFRDRLLRDGVVVPCLFITAHADTDSAEWLRSVGSNPCVIKPFDESQLLAAIDNLLQNRALPASPQ